MQWIRRMKKTAESRIKELTVVYMACAHTQAHNNSENYAPCTLFCFSRIHSPQVWGDGNANALSAHGNLPSRHFHYRRFTLGPFVRLHFSYFRAFSYSVHECICCYWNTLSVGLHGLCFRLVHRRHSKEIGTDLRRTKVSHSTINNVPSTSV